MPLQTFDQAYNMPARVSTVPVFLCTNTFNLLESRVPPGSRSKPWGFTAILNAVGKTASPHVSILWPWVIYNQYSILLRAAGETLYLAERRNGQVVATNCVVSGTGRGSLLPPPERHDAVAAALDLPHS